MTARQRIARLLPLALLVVLVIVGLRGAVPAPGWTGPLRAYGVAIGIALEVIFGVSLLVVRARERAARRAAGARPYDPAAQDKDFEPPQALRFTLTWVISMCMLLIAVAVIASLHLHFFTGARLPRRQPPVLRSSLKQQLQHGGGGGGVHIPAGPILYGLLVIAIVAAVVISVWWSTRLHRPAAPLIIEDVGTEELREAVEEGRAALADIDDARAAIIACYVAMERRLADRGTARVVADTPDELLARAVASGVVRGGAASRLTSLFYEARFSTHPLSEGKRDAARAALDQLAEELREAKPQPAPAPSQPSTGGGWV